MATVRTIPEDEQVCHTASWNASLGAGRLDVGAFVLPYVHRLEYHDKHKGWHWGVTTHDGLEFTGFAKKRKKAVKEARKHLQMAFITFCEELARIEGKEFEDGE